MCRAELQIPLVSSCISNIRNSCFKIVFSWEAPCSNISLISLSSFWVQPQNHTSLSLQATVKARGMVFRPPLSIILNPLVIQPTSRPQVTRTQTSRPESPGMTSPSPRIQIISTDSAVASPQRIQVPAPVPLRSTCLPKATLPFLNSFQKQTFLRVSLRSCAFWASNTVQLHRFFKKK